MNMIEAVKACLKKLNDSDGIENWYIRPVDWRGKGTAVEINHGVLKVVPEFTEYVRDIEFSPRLDYVLGEWEMIEPNVVMFENFSEIKREVS